MCPMGGFIIRHFCFQLVAQELPENTGDFSDAVRRIDDKYLEIQSKLIDDFVKSQRSDDLTRMKALASVLFQVRIFINLSPVYQM